MLSILSPRRLFAIRQLFKSNVKHHCYYYSLYHHHTSFSCHYLPHCHTVWDKRHFYCTQAIQEYKQEDKESDTMALSNPIGELLELCAIIRVPYSKSFEKNGQLFKCIVNFLSSKVESEWFSSQKEAEQNSALKILNTFPVRKVDDSFIHQRGSAHEMSFRAEVSSQSNGASPVITFTSEWSKKKVEAKRELLQSIAEYYFGQSEKGTKSPSTLASPSSTNGTTNHNSISTLPKSSAELYAAPAKDQTTSKLRTYIVNWQSKNLEDIKKILGPLPEPQPTALDGLLTVAFIHSSFTNSSEIEQIMEDIGLPYPNYERLEFYGDAVLGFLSSRMLLQANKKDTPHELTIKKQQLVREDACCNYMKNLKLDSYIIHRDILQTLSAKVVCDVFEAIIGALYSAYEEKAQETILRLLKPL